MNRGVIFFLLLLPSLPYPLAATQLIKYDINSELFPIPDILLKNVDFWIAVFSQYSETQAILHDTRDMNIIYEVIDISKTNADTLKSWRLKQLKVAKAKEKYRAILIKLASLKQNDLLNLTPEEKRVYNLFEGQQNEARWRLASVSIRTQFGLKEEFLKGLIRSGRFIDEMKKIFQQYNLPEELTCLPHVESSFNYKAYSKVGAAGIWQFTPKTGFRFLTIDHLIDDRIDPLRATEAAAKFLKANYDELGTWPLAITAYNHGVNGMKRAKQIVGESDFGMILQKYRSQSFKFASQNFYAEFIAAVHVRKNYRQYFGNVSMEPALEFVYFETPTGCSLNQLLQILKVNKDIVQEYNPSLRRTVLYEEQLLPKGFALRLPQKPGLDVSVAYSFFIQPENKVKTFATPINDLKFADTSQTKKKELETELSFQSPPSSVKHNSESKNIQYLPQLNANDIFAGNSVILQADESIEQFADWLEIPIQRLFQINNLDPDQELNIGQKIKLSFSNISPIEFQIRRMEYHQSIEEDFFEYYSISGVRIHKIQSGEDLWGLCDDIYEIPYWLLLKYNANLELQKLKEGDEIIFPIVISVSEKSTGMLTPGSDG